MSVKTPKPPEPPASPPPPTAVAETVEKAGGDAPKPKKTGVAALTKRRRTVGTGTTGMSGIDTTNY